MILFGLIFKTFPFVFQLNKSQAVMVALFYLKVKQLKDLSIHVVRQACKNNAILFSKKTTKDELMDMLGNKLYGKNIILINATQDMSYNNLKFC